MNHTAYTLGMLRIYLPLLRQHPTPTKMGFRPVGCPTEPGGYDGGHVWSTVAGADARRHSLARPEEFGVFELRLKGSWETDVKDGCLLYDALLVRRVDVP